MKGYSLQIKQSLFPLGMRTSLLHQPTVARVEGNSSARASQLTDALFRQLDDEVPFRRQHCEALAVHFLCPAVSKSSTRFRRSNLSMVRERTDDRIDRRIVLDCRSWRALRHRPLGDSTVHVFSKRGRTSTAPDTAAGQDAAHCSADSASGTSRIKYPPSWSRVSA
jgi:hypothetical protein